MKLEFSIASNAHVILFKINFEYEENIKFYI